MQGGEFSKSVCLSRKKETVKRSRRNGDAFCLGWSLVAIAAMLPVEVVGDELNKGFIECFWDGDVPYFH